MEENKNKIADKKSIDYNMDYREIFFVGSEVFDDPAFMNMLERWQTTNEEHLPYVACFSTNENDTKLPFYITSAGHYCVGENSYTKRSGQNDYQIIITKSGRGTITYDGEEFVAVDGTCMVIDCRKEHEYKVAKGEKWEYKHIHFSSSMESSLVKECLGFMGYVGAAEQYFDEMVGHTHTMDVSIPYIFSNIISNILTSLVIIKKKTARFNPYINLLEKAAKDIRTNFNKPIVIKDLAKKYCISVYYFIRLFKEHYNLSPYDYLIRYRVDRAKELLLRGFTAEETAKLCGFGNSNNFYKTFKRIMNMTPREYKKNVM